jgi:hypothetical protein
LKASIFIFILAMVAAGPVVAYENEASSSPTSATAEAVAVTEIAARAIDERIIGRFVSFEPSDSGPSSRYSISLDLENEDSDWSFEVTVTMEL